MNNLLGKGLSNNQIFKLFEYSMIQIDYLIMSHVFEYVTSDYFNDFGYEKSSDKRNCFEKHNFQLIFFTSCTSE